MLAKSAKSALEGGGFAASKFTKAYISKESSGRPLLALDDISENLKPSLAYEDRSIRAIES